MSSATPTTRTGLPGSPGLACGRLLHVSDPTEGATSRGDDTILVATSAARGLARQVLASRGLVVVDAAPQSHLVVLAREHGVPAIAMDPRICPTSLAAGQVALLDGDAGTLASHPAWSPIETALAHAAALPASAASTALRDLWAGTPAHHRDFLLSAAWLASRLPIRFYADAFVALAEEIEQAGAAFRVDVPRVIDRHLRHLARERRVVERALSPDSRIEDLRSRHHAERSVLASLGADVAAIDTAFEALCAAGRQRVESLRTVVRASTGASLVPFPACDEPVEVIGRKAFDLKQALTTVAPSVRSAAGWCVTTHAWRSALSADLRRELARIRREAGSEAEASRRCRARLYAEGVPDAVRLAWRSIDPGRGRYAVRSSGVGEDACLAGQLDSRLAVPAEEVPRRVAEVWWSAWDVSALGVLDRLGRAPEEEPVAVLVQQMIDCQAAGLLRTRHVTDDDAAIELQVTHGLGEAITGGETRGDRLRIGLDGRILHHDASSNRARLAADPDGTGTISIPLTEAELERPILEEPALRELAELARALSRQFGSLQVEFGIDQRQRIHLFQSTRLSG